MTHAGRTTVVVILLITVTAMDAQWCLAQSGFPADPVYEANYYLELVREKEPICLEEAERWALKTLETLKRYRGLLETERATAGLLKGEAEYELETIRQKQERVRHSIKTAEQSLKNHLLGPTGDVLQGMSGMQCDTRVQSISRSWEAESARAATLLSQGDRILSRNPKRAEELFKEAWKLDRSNLSIQSRILDAKGKQIKYGSSWAKGVLVTMAIAAALGGGYYYYRQQQRKQANGMATWR